MGALAIHVKSEHTKHKDFFCQSCNFKSSKKQILNKHIRNTHAAGKTMLQCTDCLYKTWNNGHLDQHIKAVHLSIKDFACLQCDNKFSQKVHLKNHIRTRHH